MTNVYNIWSGEKQLTPAEQKDTVKDVFESMVDFIANECPALTEYGVDNTYDAVLEYIAEHDARA